MQDIPRNELLDKLAAGWKCRRKSWEENHPHFFSLKENEVITPSALVADDWEGEPPLPVKNYKDVDILTALRHLRGGAAFIRRVFWCGEKPITSKAPYLHLSVDDILATDWEVWG